MTTHQTLYVPIAKAVNLGIVLLSSTNQLSVQLLDGRDKVIVIEWNGDTSQIDDPENFDPLRGDGRVTITYPGQMSYQVPPSTDLDDINHNIRMAVPVWVLNTAMRKPVVLGMGHFFPLYTSAGMVFYDPQTRRKTGTYYMGDPRVRPSKPWPEGHPTLDEQRQHLLEANCGLEPTPILAPAFNVPWYG